MKTCCFFGHRKYSSSKEVISALEAKLEELVLSGFSNFLFGGYSDFDYECLSAVKRLKKRYSGIKTIFVQAYYKPIDNDMEYLKTTYDEVIYPPIESAPKRFAISHRNREIINMSDYCIFYVEFSFGGAAAALRRAKSANKPLINLAPPLSSR